MISAQHRRRECMSFSIDSMVAIDCWLQSTIDPLCSEVPWLCDMPPPRASPADARLVSSCCAPAAPRQKASNAFCAVDVYKKPSGSNSWAIASWARARLSADATAPCDSCGGRWDGPFECPQPADPLPEYEEAVCCEHEMWSLPAVGS